jgi:citrate lyase subunit beta / citryl-CoA lyase
MKRSFHFIPGDKTQYIEKIDLLDADYFIFDLEDAVSPENKQGARKNTAAFLKSVKNGRFFVRINPVGTEEYEKDILCLKLFNDLNVVIPKVISTDCIKKVTSRISVKKIVVLIESFEGLDIIRNIDFNIFAAGLGLEDMLSELPFSNCNLNVLSSAVKTEFVLNCRKNGITPIDGIPSDIFDTASLKSECEYARSLGFEGKFSVHPSHIPVINNGFYPDKDEIEWAENVKNETGFVNRGYYRSSSGEILTPPKFLKAKKILDYIKGDDHG